MQTAEESKSIIKSWMTFIGLFFLGIGQTQWCGKENYAIKRRDGRAIGSLRLVDQEVGKVIILRHC